MNGAFCKFILLISCMVLMNVAQAADYANATFVGKPDLGKLVCKKGEFWDPRNGGECWSCKDKARTIFGVDGNKACETPAKIATAKATRKISNTVSCPSGSFVDPRNGGECWTCPSGSSRTANSVTGTKACSKKIAKVKSKASYSYNTGSLLTACKKGTFANAGSTKCYKCSSGYKHDGGKKVSTSGVCYKPAKTAHYKAAKKSTLVGLNCPKGTFFDAINGGSCWSCPGDYIRGVSAVNSSTACTKAVTPQFAKASFQRAAQVSAVSCNSVKEGSFFDLSQGGSCWSCGKKNPVRTLYGVTTDQACATNTCGKMNGRPCYVWERVPSCNRGLAEDPFTNSCQQPKDFACEATVKTVAALYNLTGELERQGKKMSQEALEEIPGAMAMIRFATNQISQAQSMADKLAPELDTSKLDAEITEIVGEQRDQIARFVDRGAALGDARRKVEQMLFDPALVCGRNPDRILSEFQALGLADLISPTVAVDPSLLDWVIPKAYASGGVISPGMSHSIGLSLGFGFPAGAVADLSLSIDGGVTFLVTEKGLVYVPDESGFGLSVGLSKDVDLKKQAKVDSEELSPDMDLFESPWSIGAGFGWSVTDTKSRCVSNGGWFKDKNAIFTLTAPDITIGPFGPPATAPSSDCSTRMVSVDFLEIKRVQDEVFTALFEPVTKSNQARSPLKALQDIGGPTIGVSLSIGL